MTTYFVDHAGSNTAPYDTQAKAATTLATILALPPAAGDIIYCCDNAGTGEILSGSALTIASSGTNAAGWIKLIGCNSSGVVDGTRYYINANGGSHNVLSFAGNDLWWLENIEVGNTGAGVYDGFQSSTAGTNGHVFINCCAHNCGSSGFASRFDYSLFFRCTAYSNGATGITAQYSPCYAFCCCRDNTGDGYGGGDATIFGCIAHGNGDNGIEANDTNKIINCVLDGNVDSGILKGATTNTYGQIVLGCRFTNHSGGGADAGIDCSSDPLVMAYNYFEDNTANIANQIAGMGLIPSGYSGGSAVDSNLYNLANTNEGYVDKTNHDFSTNYVDSGDPDLRRTAITIPWS